MTNTHSQIRHIFAPAKINLFLHVTGRKDDYHLLDSLVVFADIGDEVILEPAVDFSFEITGPFASHFRVAESDCSPNSGNLLVRAVWKMAEAARKKPDVKITLVKNLPLASGLGGSSTDAAAAIWGLLEHWRMVKHPPFLADLLLNLGADVPACLDCRPVLMRGKGEILSPIQEMPELPILLVNPGVPCKTGMVFSLFPGPFRTEREVPEAFQGKEKLIEFLRECDNDLTNTATEIAPEIVFVMEQLQACKKILLSRMCGSGATCYALFDTIEDAQAGAQMIRETHPSWWVETGWINRPQRY